METERKDFRMFSLEERERAVELYFTTPMTTAQVVEHLGYPTRQCLERWLAMDSRYAGHMAKPIIPLETRRRAVELVLGGMQQKQAAKQLGVSVGAVHGWVRAYRKGGMAALQPKNRNSAQGNKPAGSRRWPSAADDDDAEALRRRVEELELENALMREVVEVVKKDPGADLRRLSNREKTLLIDRLRPAYSLSSMTCLLAIAPSSYHYHHARLGVDKYAGLRAEVAGAFADSKGRYGYRRIKAVLKTGVSEKVVRRIMAEEGLVAHVPKRRRYSSYEGETTPAPANLVDRDFTAERPNEKWLTDISEIKARDGKGVPFADDRLLRWQDRRIHRRLQPQRGAGQPDAGESGLDAARERASPGAFRPWMPLPVARMARAHGTLRADALHEREGPFAGQRGRGGILRQDEDRGGLPREVGGTHPQRGARLGR